MLQTPATNFIKMAENWYRDTPLRNVRLDYVDGRNAPPLFKLPELRHLHTLNLHLAYRETTPLSYLTDLCACQELTNLRVLYLHGLPFDDIAAWMLLDSRYLKGLNTLALPAGNMSESVRSAFHARFGPKCLR